MKFKSVFRKGLAHLLMGDNAITEKQIEYFEKYGS